jgi:hypothetical protein
MSMKRNSNNNRRRTNRKAGKRRTQGLREGAEPLSAQGGDIVRIRKPLSQPIFRNRPAKPLTRELKAFDGNITPASTVSTTMTIVRLSGINQGTTVTNRIGDSLSLASIEVRSAAAMTIATDFTNQLRMIVFQWCQDDNVYAPAVADIVTFVAAGQSTVSPIVHDNANKIDVLVDHLFALSGTGESIKTFHVIPSRFRLPQIQYNPAAINGEGNLYIAYVSDSAAIPFPVLSASWRINFYDD